MAADTDEDALSWHGDSDPTLVTGKKSAPAASSASGSKPAKTAAKEAVVHEKPHTSSFLLVSYGILAGAYLLYTVGWVVAITNNGRVPTDSVLTEIMTVSGEYLAIASGALWFAGVFLLTRHSKAIVRLLWLLAGLLLLIPWPFVLIGLVGGAQ
jgi:hypothetical protein